MKSFFKLQTFVYMNWIYFTVHETAKINLGYVFEPRTSN